MQALEIHFQTHVVQHFDPVGSCLAPQSHVIQSLTPIRYDTLKSLLCTTVPDGQLLAIVKQPFTCVRHWKAAKLHTTVRQPQVPGMTRKTCGTEA